MGKISEEVSQGLFKLSEKEVSNTENRKEGREEGRESFPLNSLIFL